MESVCGHEQQLLIVNKDHVIKQFKWILKQLVSADVQIGKTSQKCKTQDYL